MTLERISAAKAAEMVRDGAQIIDIRGADEHARVAIPGALNRPLEELAEIEADAPALIFHCRSGMRTAANAGRLAEATSCKAYVLDGGIEAWRRAGLPVRTDRRQPIELQRQVQITAGLLVLSGILLGWLASAAWFALSAFVGAGLIVAGVSGTCGMARMLALMPWNRRAAA